MKSLIRAGSALILVLSAACATTPQAQRREEVTHLLAQDSGVRVDANVLVAPTLSTNSAVSISYDIENLRSEAIAIADMVPETTYDSGSRTVTVSFGSEVPGNTLVPRLVRIDPGTKKTFKGKAVLDFLLADQVLSPPRYLQIRVNFLDDVRPFAALLGVPETAIADKGMADALFPAWVEHNVAVVTNSMPIRWGGSPFTADPNRPNGF